MQRWRELNIHRTRVVVWSDGANHLSHFLCVNENVSRLLPSVCEWGRTTIAFENQEGHTLKVGFESYSIRWLSESIRVNWFKLGFKRAKTN